MVDRQLRVLLRIIVGLVVIVGSRVGSVDSSSGIFARRVVATVGAIDAVGGVVIYSIPSHARLLATTKETGNYLRFHIMPAQIAIIGIEVGSCSVEKSVGIDLGESCIGTPLVGQHDMRRYHLAEGVVHTSVEGYA